jgi:hypothetical protein
MGRMIAHNVLLVLILVRVLASLAPTGNLHPTPISKDAIVRVFSLATSASPPTNFSLLSTDTPSIIAVYSDKFR